KKPEREGSCSRLDQGGVVAHRAHGPARGPPHHPEAFWRQARLLQQNLEPAPLARGGTRDRLRAGQSVPVAEAGTVRGLHYQAPPHVQAKLVRCGRGRLLDVAVDARAVSATCGRWVAAETAPGGWGRKPAGFPPHRQSYGS